MNVGVAHSELNPNTTWLNSKGMWITYTLATAALHYIILSVPWFSVAVAWTLTNVAHNVIMYMAFHYVKGAPWETGNQGKDRYLTHWEQMDHGEQYTATKKFLTFVPIVLFLLASFYTKYDHRHFVINAVALMAVLLPKLPYFHRKRFFGINEY
ncbi:ORM1-like protein 2 [Saccoglossus kowalevskii]|uniref:ORM1-like protein 2-like n=1 Tax=Saccoglossus kowalevskii TaxID=10224 RepID=A0ABM0GX04_SACKO|nr:PREDICTED: ORM1-like protein 2-like [Saccoglossus kowalevskii]